VSSEELNLEIEEKVEKEERRNEPGWLGSKEQYNE